MAFWSWSPNRSVLAKEMENIRNTPLHQATESVSATVVKDGDDNLSILRDPLWVPFLFSRRRTLRYSSYNPVWQRVDSRQTVTSCRSGCPFYVMIIESNKGHLCLFLKSKTQPTTLFQHINQPSFLLLSNNKNLFINSSHHLKLTQKLLSLFHSPINK